MTVKSRGLSFLILLLVYTAAAALARVIYPLFDIDYLHALLICDVIATVFIFIFSILFENSSVYDPYWFLYPMVVIVFYAIGYGLTLFGILLLCAICFWGLRLLANWAFNFYGLEYQDYRYILLKEKTKRAYPVINFIVIHIIPSLVIYLCLMPVVIAICGKIQMDNRSLTFICISFVASIIQGALDLQMHFFKKKSAQDESKKGLMKFARYSTYVCEILMWWGIGLACYLSMSQEWYLLAGAAVNTVYFIFVSLSSAEKPEVEAEILE